jgi:molecular chaperone GrpE
MTSKPTNHHDQTTETDQAAEQAFAEQAKSSDQATLEDVGTAAEFDVANAQFETELAAANERVIRAHAELENFRKRVYREMEDDRKYASMPLLRDLLPVMDNLQRAMDSAEQNLDSQGLLEGVRLVAQQFEAVFQQHHCTRIDAKGKLFNPHLHEAIAQLPSQDVPKGVVIDVHLAGYALHDRVVRASQVLVSAGPPTTADSSDD